MLVLLSIHASYHRIVPFYAQSSVSRICPIWDLPLDPKAAEVAHDNFGCRRDLILVIAHSGTDAPRSEVNVSGQ